MNKALIFFLVWIISSSLLGVYGAFIVLRGYVIWGFLLIVYSFCLLLFAMTVINHIRISKLERVKNGTN